MHFIHVSITPLPTSRLTWASNKKHGCPTSFEAPKEAKSHGSFSMCFLVAVASLCIKTLSRQETPNSVAVFSCWKSWMTSPCQDPVSAASRATFARSLYENFLYKISVWGSPQQDPVGALVQDRCMRISCARCLWQDLLGSCKSTCARSVCVCADLLCRFLYQEVCIKIL